MGLSDEASGVMAVPSEALAKEGGSAVATFCEGSIFGGIASVIFLTSSTFFTTGGTVSFLGSILRASFFSSVLFGGTAAIVIGFLGASIGVGFGVAGFVDVTAVFGATVFLVVTFAGIVCFLCRAYLYA